MTVREDREEFELQRRRRLEALWKPGVLEALLEAITFAERESPLWARALNAALTEVDFTHRVAHRVNDAATRDVLHILPTEYAKYFGLPADHPRVRLLELLRDATA